MGGGRENREKWGNVKKSGGNCGIIIRPRSKLYEQPPPVAEKWWKTRGKWNKNGEKWDEIPVFPNPIPPIFPEAADLPHGKLGKFEKSVGIRKFGYLEGLQLAHTAQACGPPSLPPSLKSNFCEEATKESKRTSAHSSSLCN